MWGVGGIGRFPPKTDDYVNYVAPPNSYSLTATYKELQDKYSCNKFTFSRAFKELEMKGFITRQCFFVKSDDDDESDKSVWRITVTSNTSWAKENNIDTSYGDAVRSAYQESKRLEQQCSISQQEKKKYTKILTPHIGTT